MDPLNSFHPAVRRWFEERFPEGPSEPQLAGWPSIAERKDTLIAAPTGSGKTLAAFLVCIDEFFRRSLPSGRGERPGLREDEPFQLIGDPAVTPGGRGRAPSASRGPGGRGGRGGEAEPGVEVLYISPLKALAADIQENLRKPLAEIGARATAMGLPAPEVRIGMRSGDTKPSARAAMLKKPPQILVTTPESLYLLLTSGRGREILKTVRTVIVDEIHALARDKRGSHLAISLERLDALTIEKPTRIGLSATQRPIETVARLLVGAGADRTEPEGRPKCEIVDSGHRRQLDLATVLPGSDLEAVASAEQMNDVLNRIGEEVQHHQTTLVFVNTRRMAERMAHQLAERLGEEGVAAHHGSLSKNRRLRVESALRAGQLRALVATASLELGIDVGPVELVCQIGSPRSIATFLQRVGRAGHFRGGIPKGRIFPLTRDELVECAALLRGVGAGHLDRVLPPAAPLDILAQQIVAACAAEPWKEDELYGLMTRAAPFEKLAREQFDEVVELVSEGIETGRGRRAAYVHRDKVGGMLRARRGARLAALTSGGAIPDVADYRVVAEPDETFIGTVGEDFAIDSMAGDVFLLGTTSWRIQRVEAGVVRVVDAEGQQPNVPHWAGEAPARTAELSDEVSALREWLEPALERGDEAEARRMLEAECSLGPDASVQIARYLGVSRAALGGLPTRDRLVLERFFDDAGGMQLVIHSPRGGRFNRALCLALRKKFCKSFNFELQAAANDDAMVLSLGPHHSFPLQDVPRFLSSNGLETTLCQAVLPTPLFTARWRWNLNRSLAVLRFRSGKKNPPAIQRMESDDLMAAVFPQAAACQENVAGPIEIPDHPLVRQTMDDCLTDAMDAASLLEWVGGIESGALETLCVDTTEPSPLAHEILNGKPFTFLDDAPLEERRTRAVKMRRGLPVEERDLTRLSPEAVAKVRDQAAPEPRDREELHDLLLGAGWIEADPRWSRMFNELRGMARAFEFLVEAESVGAGPSQRFWAASERADWVRAVHPEAVPPGARVLVADDPALTLDGAALTSDGAPLTEDVALAHALRGHLETTGPIGVSALARRVGVRPGLVEIGLAGLEAEGFVLRGHFDSDAGPGEVEQFCARRLLARIHADSTARKRASVKPVTAQDFMRFLLEWQHVTPNARLDGPQGVAEVIEQLQGFDLAAGAWESEVLAQRIRGYRPEWLDGHCLSGRIGWLRLSPPAPPVHKTTEAGAASLRAETDRAERTSALKAGSAAVAGPTSRTSRMSRSTPLSMVYREDLEWLLQGIRGPEPVHRKAPDASPLDPELLGAGAGAGAGANAEGPLTEGVRRLLEERGALFHAEMVAALGESPVEVESALWEGVAEGRLWADGFQALRGLIGARSKTGKPNADRRARRGLRRGQRGAGAAAGEGRWSTVPMAEGPFDRDALAEAIAEQLLSRWGIVFRDVVMREHWSLPWREIVWALRRLEARGVIRGGRFISGFTGEQFALPGALETLARVRKAPRTGERIELSGSDPLNLVGILTPGQRIPAVRTRRVVFIDGLPVQPDVLDEAEAV